MMKAINMNQKVLKKPTLVLMAGLPGVGKTTLALELGQRLGWVVLERDMLKEPLLVDPVLKEKFDEDSAGWAAYEYSLSITENFLVNQRLSVILDTSLLRPFILKRAEDILERLEKLTERSGAQLKIILCEVDESTRQHRLRTRKARVSQAKAHLVPKEAAQEFDKLDPSAYKRIETNRPLESYLEETLTYVTAQELEPETESYQSVPAPSNHFTTLVFLFVQWLILHKAHAAPHLILSLHN